jgi:hypothetical protein
MNIKDRISPSVQISGPSPRPRRSADAVSRARLCCCSVQPDSGATTGLTARSAG